MGNRIACCICVVLLSAVAGCALDPGTGSRLPEPSTGPVERLKRDRPVVALALGSGGARGFAHVGVIKVLEAAGIPIDIVVGSSSGAVVAALYAGGYSAEQLGAIAHRLDTSDLIDVSPFDGFRVRGERLARFVTETLDYRPMEGLQRAFAVVTTDAQSGSLTVFNRGNPGLAVRASSSVPRLFVAPVIGGREYLDGGLVSPVPVKLALAMGADIVIAVDISRVGAARSAPVSSGAGQSGAASRSSRRILLDAELALASVVIRPRLPRSGLLDFDQKDLSIAAGEDAARTVLPALEQALASAAHARSVVIH